MLTRAQAVAELERIYEILPQIASALADERKPVASLVQNVWRSVCGVICGKGLSLCCLLYFFTIRTNWD